MADLLSARPLCEIAHGIFTALGGGLRRHYHPILRLRKLRLREFGNLLTVYTVSQWRGQYGIRTPGTHAWLLFLYLALERVDLKESDNNLPGKAAPEGQGEEPSSPQRLPSLPWAGHQTGNLPNQTGSFFTWPRLRHLGSQVCSEGCEQPSPGKLGQRPARSHGLAVWPWVDLASLCLCPTTRTLAIERVI